MKMRLFALAGMLLMFAGCASTLVRETPRRVALTPDVAVDMAPVVEKLLDHPCSFVQAVSGAWKDHAVAGEFVVKNDGTNMTVVVLAPGMRLATIKAARPHRLQYERARQIPAAFEPEYLLLDLALVNLDDAELRKCLGPEVVVERVDGARRLRVGERMIATLSPRAEDGTQRFENHVRDYGYTLKDLEL